MKESDLTGVVQMMQVPADYIIYKAKLTGGRVIDFPLPHKFSAADADRLCAFLRTQVDEWEKDPAAPNFS